MSLMKKENFAHKNNYNSIEKKRPFGLYEEEEVTLLVFIVIFLFARRWLIIF